jgi:predicted RNA-binding protein with PIN domain
MYVIDGHNLISCLPGVSLSEIDDEEQLIELLQAFSRRKRKRVEVFFDQAPPGYAGERRAGLVRAHFVSAESKADDAILRGLQRMGRGEARNAVVVSSDHQVQANARALGASVVASEVFARELELSSASGASQAGSGPTKTPSQPARVAGVKGEELDEWYELFGVDPSRADAPVIPARGDKKPSRHSPKRRWHKD